MSMEVFQGKLFVGTADLGGDGFSLFYYDSVNDSNPTILTQTGFGGNTYVWTFMTKGCGSPAMEIPGSPCPAFILTTLRNTASAAWPAEYLQTALNTFFTEPRLIIMDPRRFVFLTPRAFSR